ncbi:hypothetical protein P8853_14570 [Bacillus haynesii]|nr:hypothetical protein [Bacillus haynesii]
MGSTVGLAPGLTNLLAQKAAQALDETSCIDIAIMLGLGDSHGKAAIEWTVDHLNMVYDVKVNGRLMEVSSFTPADKLWRAIGAQDSVPVSFFRPGDIARHISRPFCFYPALL